MSHIGDIFVRLRLDSKAFNKELKGVQGMAVKVGKTVAAAFTVRSIANFSKQCLELGSDLQEVQNVVDTTFDSVSGKVNQFAKDAAKTYGLSETMAKKYTGTFGAMAKAFGYGEAEAYKMSTALTGLAGDVASFYNLSQDEAYTKLKSVFTGETESLKDLGVVMTQTALDQYALANGFEKTTSAMTEAEKVSLRYAFVQNQLSAASGDFAKTSNSWANQVRVLSLQFESLKASIGQGLINVLTPVIKVINTLMSKLVAAANAFKEFTATLFGKQTATQTQIATDSSDGLDSVTESANAATGATSGTTDAVKKLKRELAGFDQITKLGSEDSSSGTSGSSTSSGTGTTTTTTPTTGMPSENDISKLTEKYENLATSISGLKEKFKAFTDLLSDAGKWVYDNVLKPLGKWTMNELAPAVIDLLAASFDVLTKAAEILKPVWKWIWDNFLSKMASFIGDAIILCIKEFTYRLELAAESFGVIGDALKALPGKIAGVKDSVKAKWAEVKAVITGKVVDFKARVATKWKDIKASWNALKSNVKGKIAEMKAKVSTKKKELKEKWSNLTSLVKDKVVTITAKLKDNITQAVKTMWNGIAKGINSAINTINKIPGVNIGKLPMLAQGGYVKKNTPQLAMIGDNRHYGEIVAPENKLQEMARMAAAGAGGTSPEVITLLREIVELLKTLDLDVTIDGKSLMQIIVRLINNQTKNTGRCPINV